MIPVSLLCGLSRVLTHSRAIIFARLQSGSFSRCLCFRRLCLNRCRRPCLGRRCRLSWRCRLGRCRCCCLSSSLFLHGKLFLTHCMCQSSTGYVPAAVHPHIRTYIISTLIPYARIPLSRAFRPEGSDPGSPGLVTAQSEVSLTQMPECGSTVSSLFRRS